MDKEIKDALDSLTYGIEKSIRYHQRRRGFLEHVHRCTMFLVILSSSGAVSSFVVDLGWERWFALAAAVLAALDLTTGVGVLARDYAMLHGKFSSLLAEIAKVATPTLEQVLEWKARRIEIESEEPPIYWVVEADCDNEICLARGRREKAVRIGQWRRLFMHVLRQEGFNPQRS
jgi:hypothetical protein